MTRCTATRYAPVRISVSCWIEVSSTCWKVIKDELKALVEEGVPYVQIDAPRYSYYVDPRWREHLQGLGMDPEAALDEAIAADNACSSVVLSAWAPWHRYQYVSEGVKTMPSVSFSGTIARAPAEVFAFVTDPAMHPKWQTNVIEAEIVSETPERVGSVGREVRQFMGKRVETTYRVTVFEPGRRFKTESISGPVPGEIGADFEPLEDGGTYITLHATFHLGGAFRLAGPIAGRMLRAETEANFKTLKALLEA